MSSTVILSAILQVVDDLQRGAERVIGGPSRAALAVNVEHEASDWHGRVRAIAHQVVPVAVAQLGHIHSEGGEQILRVARRELAICEVRAQGDAGRISVALAEQGRLESSDERKLLPRRKRRVIGNVVGGAHEVVERQDWPTMARIDAAATPRENFRPGGLCQIAHRQE